MDTKAPIRFTKLDGLRGLLALIVCLNHSFMVVAIPSFADVWRQNPLIFNGLQSKIQQLFMFLGNGGAAVTLFFLLSGFVLGPSLAKVAYDFRGLLGFIVKRLIRLYPVYLLIAILTAVYMKSGFVYQTFPASSNWFNWWMNFEMTLKEFFLNAAFIHTYLGGVTWTLRVILIVSFIFPLFFLFSQKTSKWLDLIFVVLLIYCSFTLFDIPGFRDLRYLYMFYLGLIIPKFSQMFSLLPGSLINLFSPLLVCLLLGFRYLTNEYLGGVVESFVSFIFIGLIVYNSKTSLFNFLDSSFFRFYGKISYSLYLIHFSVLYLFARLMFIQLPALPYTQQYLAIHLVLFFISTLTATGVAALVYHFLELPSQKLANKIGFSISKQ